MYLHIAKILMVGEQDLQGKNTGKCVDTVWIDSVGAVSWILIISMIANSAETIVQ